MASMTQPLLVGTWAMGTWCVARLYWPAATGPQNSWVVVCGVGPLSIKELGKAGDTPGNFRTRWGIARWLCVAGTGQQKFPGWVVRCCHNHGVSARSPWKVQGCEGGLTCHTGAGTTPSCSDKESYMPGPVPSCIFHSFQPARLPAFLLPSINSLYPPMDAKTATLPAPGTAMGHE